MKEERNYTPLIFQKGTLDEFEFDFFDDGTLQIQSDENSRSYMQAGRSCIVLTKEQVEQLINFLQKWRK